MATVANAFKIRKGPRVRVPAGLLTVLALAALAGGVGSAPALAESTPSACSLYASSSGSDSNPGTRAAPFATLKKLVTALAAGQTGCLESGQTFDGAANSSLTLRAGETHGTEAAPVTITSTEPGDPAIISHSLSLVHGANYLVFSHLVFSWSMPRPWTCWSAQGNPVPGEVLANPSDGKCEAGTPNPEDHVQISISGKDDSFVHDQITSNSTNICFNVGNYGGSAEHTVLEHDRIYNCGPPVQPVSAGGTNVPNEEWGWHSHGVYDYGHETIVRNDYIYGNSRNGVLLYGGGEGALVEHNVIDGNGNGVNFGANRNNTVRWNIITNSSSPRGQDDYGIAEYQAGSGNSAEHNCLYNNESGEIAVGSAVKVSENKTHTNPLYTNAANHEYTLQSASPCVGYGPDTAQPGATVEPGEEAASQTPPGEAGSGGGTSEGESAGDPPSEEEGAGEGEVAYGEVSAYPPVQQKSSEGSADHGHERPHKRAGAREHHALRSRRHHHSRRRKTPASDRGRR